MNWDALKWEGAGKYEFSLVTDKTCEVMSEIVQTEEQLKKRIEGMAHFYGSDELDYCMRVPLVKAESCWCGGMAKLRKVSEDRINVELYTFNAGARHADKPDYKPLLEKFGGRYNQKSHSVTVNHYSIIAVEHFVMWNLIPNVNIMTMIEN